MRRTRCWFVVVAALALSACSTTPDEELESTGTSALPIWNGASASGPVVYVTSGNQKGSGVALTNNWVLTAFHNVMYNDWTVARASPGGAGTTEYSPTYATTITAYAWAWATTSSDVKKYDLALLRFPDMPIMGTTTGYETPVFTQSAQPGTVTDQIVALGQVQCLGYGLGGSSGAEGILRSATLDVKHDDFMMSLPEYPPDPIHMVAPVNFFTTPTSGKQIAKGDSGGGCFDMGDGSLVGIIRAIETTAPNPAPRAVITSVGAYSNEIQNLNRQLQRIVDTNPLTAQFGEVDGDGNPDLLMTSVDGGYLRFQMQLTNTAFPPEGFVDFNDMGLLSSWIPAGLADTVLATVGDFDGDGYGDVFGLWEGDAVYLDGRPGRSTVASSSLRRRPTRPSASATSTTTATTTSKASRRAGALRRSITAASTVSPPRPT